jgi:hypothetical protein
VKRGEDKSPERDVQFKHDDQTSSRDEERSDKLHLLSSDFHWSHFRCHKFLCHVHSWQALRRQRRRRPMSSLPTSLPSSTSTFVPTTRSRTLLFISYRDSSARAPRTSRSSRPYEDSYDPNDENEGLINDQGTPHISLDVGLPPKWFVRSESHIAENNPFDGKTGWTMLNR